MDSTAETIDFAAAFGTLADSGTTALSVAAGGQSIRLLAFNGVGGWHRHDSASETVIVWDGRFDVEYRDRTVSLGAGQCTVIAPGQEHRGVSHGGARVVLMRTAEAG